MRSRSGARSALQVRNDLGLQLHNFFKLLHFPLVDAQLLLLCWVWQFSLHRHIVADALLCLYRLVDEMLSVGIASQHRQHVRSMTGLFLDTAALQRTLGVSRNGLGAVQTSLHFRLDRLCPFVFQCELVELALRRTSLPLVDYNSIVTYLQPSSSSSSMISEG